MTTPEAFKRRQLIEGTFLVFLGITMVIQAWYFHHEDNLQRGCLQDKLSTFSSISQERGTLVDKDAKITVEDSQNKTRLIKGLVSAKTPADSKKVLTEYETNQRLINAKRHNLAIVRSQTKLPDLPSGVCGNDS